MKHLYFVSAFFLATVFCANAMPSTKVFIKNDGRWPSQVLYSAATPNAIVWITTTGMVVDQRVKNANNQVVSSKVTFDVIGSKGSRNTAPVRCSNSPIVRILSNSAPQGPLQTASSVVVRNVLPGMHLEYVFEGDDVRYNVLADSRVNVPNPLFSVKSAGPLQTTATGISCKTDVGQLSMSGLVSTQNNGAKNCPSTWTTTQNAFGFNVLNRDWSRSLVIDPVVSVMGLYGGNDEAITCMKMNKQGNVVVAGWTTSFDFDVPSGGLNSTGGAGVDGFVAVVSADLETVLSWTYIAGDSSEAIRSMALNSKDEIWVVGETNSTNLPVKGTSLYQNHGVGLDGFVLLLSPDLSQTVAGMYIPGNANDWALGVAVNGIDQAVIVGTTSSTGGLPTIPGYDNTPNGDKDAFMMVVHPKLINVAYFTYFGGSSDDSFDRVAIDDNGAAVICGTTKSNNMPTWPEKKLVFVPGDGRGSADMWVEVGNNPFDVDYNGGESDVMVVKFTASGELSYSTYFGGKGADVAADLFIDDDGGAFVVGSTSSNNLPIPLTSPLAYGGKWDGFVALFSSDGLKLRGAGYLGGSDDDFITSVVKDAGSVGVVVGSTTSNDFPIFGVGSSMTPVGGSDCFLTRLSTEELKNSTYIGWTGNDYANSVVRDALGDNFIGGQTESKILAQPTASTTDAFIAKWAYGTLQYLSPTVSDPLCLGKTVSIRWSTADLPVGEPAFVDFSTDDGGSWSLIAKDVKSKSFNFTLPPTLTANDQCRFRVRSIHGHVATSDASLNVVMSPVITIAPQPVLGCPNKSISLTVGADGTNVTYQWRKDGLPISGAVKQEYSIESSQTSDVGSYDVVITNACATATSAAVMVELSDKPVIDKQPKDQAILMGESATLSVEARGLGLQYQWSKDGSPLADEKFKKASFTIASIDDSDSGSYTCAISSDCGTITSEVARLFFTLTGIEEDTYGSANGVRVYPQPANGVVTIVVPPLGTVATMLIQNGQGAEVYRTSVAANSDATMVEIDVNNLSNGGYSVVILGQHTLITARLSVLK